jgi:hypothetical protein
MVHPDQLIILAVAHMKKKPGYWANRIDDPPPAARRTKRESVRSTSRAAAWKEGTEQTSLPRSAEDFLRIFSRGLFLLDENTASSTFGR